jgi:ATP-binding cassette, subfamily B, bacterial MsbA
VFSASAPTGAPQLGSGPDLEVPSYGSPHAAPPEDELGFWARLRRYGRHAHHIRGAWLSLIGGILAGAIYSISTGAGLPLMFKTLLPIFFGKEEEASPVVVAVARSWFGEDYVERLLLLACLGLPLIFALRGLAAYLNRYLINKAGFVVLENLRSEVYGKLLALPLAFFQRNKAADLQGRVMGDTDRLKVVLVNVSSELVKQPLTLVAALGYLVYLSITERSALFALIAILSVPLCVLPIRVAARQLARRSRQLAERGSELGAVVMETLQAPLEVQAYNLQERQRAAFAERTREIFRLSLKTVKYHAMVTPMIEVVSVCGFVAALYFGTREGMDFATFSSLALALYFAYEPVKKLSTVHATLKTGEVSLERLEYVLDAPDFVPAPAQPKALPKGPLGLEFQKVSFAYPSRGGLDGRGKHSAALLDLDLNVAAGETVALVGRTGAGKSTFVALLPRFFDPQAGVIRLGGVDLRELDKTELRGRIAVVQQSPVLFAGTFADNIRLGRPEASDAQVVDAARRAQIHDFIAGLPHGYATPVGERGGSLSGGQRQRVAIARAFLKDAPILILDEATSALDSESEALVQRALAELVQGRTTFMIAHRFSSIRHATRVLVLDGGRLVGDGSPAELYARHTLYRELCDHQNLEGMTRPGSGVASNA